MKSFVTWTALQAAGTLTLIGVAYQAAAQRSTSLPMMRLYTGPDGLTHADKVDLPFHPSPLREGLEEASAAKVSGAQFIRWPPGYTWGWHTASKPQYVITVSGHGEVELAGGQKIPLDPGRILIAGDVTGKGHITRTIGTEDLVLLLLPLTPSPP